MATLQQLIGLAVSLSMAGLLMSVAFRTDFGHLLGLLRRPGLLVRSLFAMNVVMPLVAVGMALALDLNHVVELTLVAMALGPIPPILPGKELKAGGTRSYIMGLLTVSAAVSIIFVPVAAAVLGRTFDLAVDVTPKAVAGIVATWMLLPIFIGMLVHAVAPQFASRAATPLALASVMLLVLALVPILVKTWPVMLTLVGDYSILAIVAFVVIGLAVGHFLGGPDPSDRSVLALSTAARHPGVAMAVLHAGGDRELTLASVLLVLLVSAAVTGVYVIFRRHDHGAKAPGTTQA